MRFGQGVVVKGDVTLDNSGGKVMDDYVTVQNTEFESGVHVVEAPAQAPAAAPQLTPAMA